VFVLLLLLDYLILLHQTVSAAVVLSAELKTDCTVPQCLCICAPLNDVSAGLATGPKLLCLLHVNQEINYRRIQGNNYHQGDHLYEVYSVYITDIQQCTQLYLF